MSNVLTAEMSKFCLGDLAQLNWLAIEQKLNVRAAFQRSRHESSTCVLVSLVDVGNKIQQVLDRADMSGKPCQEMFVQAASRFAGVLSTKHASDESILWRL